MAAAEMYSLTAAAAAQHQQRGKAATHAWQVVVGWIGFLLQVLLQILRGTPSWAQLLSFVTLPLLSPRRPGASHRRRWVFLGKSDVVPAELAAAAIDAAGRRRLGFSPLPMLPIWCGFTKRVATYCTTAA
ncbi:hypothetical protein ZWY2020_032564 [Hordeum vulgare]|nr:hypothetical protein ZWY2020_032564 [Hordeum vulgare]